MSAQSESLPCRPQQQLAELEATWLALLVLPAVEAQSTLDQWRPIAQHLINHGHGQVVLLVLEGVLRQASIRSQRQSLLNLCAAALHWPAGDVLLQRQWQLLQRWLA
jgi:hypothetical protein